MRQAILRMQLDYDLTQKDLVGGPAEDFYWEMMYKALRRKLPPGPLRFYEKREHLSYRPAFELRLYVKVPDCEPTRYAAQGEPLP